MSILMICFTALISLASGIIIGHFLTKRETTGRHSPQQVAIYRQGFNDALAQASRPVTPAIGEFYRQAHERRQKSEPVHPRPDMSPALVGEETRLIPKYLTDTTQVIEKKEKVHEDEQPSSGWTHL